MPCVFSFTILADDNPVKVFGTTVLERRVYATEDAGRTYVNVLIQHITNGENEAPQGDMVRDVYMTELSVRFQNLHGFRKFERSRAIESYLAILPPRSKWHRISSDTPTRLRAYSDPSL